jgi:hypothetical protein
MQIASGANETLGLLNVNFRVAAASQPIVKAYIAGANAHMIWNAAYLDAPDQKILSALATKNAKTLRGNKELQDQIGMQRGPFHRLLATECWRHTVEFYRLGGVLAFNKNYDGVPDLLIGARRLANNLMADYLSDYCLAIQDMDERGVPLVRLWEHRRLMGTSPADAEGEASEMPASLRASPHFGKHGVKA